MRTDAPLKFRLFRITVTLAVLIAACAYLIERRPVSAAAKSWDGSASSDWNDGNNWTPAGVPSSADDVTLPVGALPNQPSITAGDVTIHNLTVSAGRTLTIGTGRILTIDGSTVAAVVSNSGSVTAGGTGVFRTQGTVSFNEAGTFTAALQVNTGTTTVTNTSSFDAGSSITIDAGATLFGAAGVETTLGNLTNNGTLSGVAFASTFAFSGTGTNCVNNGSITVNTFSFNNGAQNLSGSTGTWTGANLFINNSANVTLTSDVTIGSPNFRVGNTGAGTVNPGGFTLTLSSAVFTSTATGNVTGAGTFRTQGTTSVTVTAGGTFTSAFQVNTGTTTFTNNTVFPAGSSITIDAGATLFSAAGVETTNGNLTNNGTLSGSVSSTFAFSGTGTNCVNNGSITVNTFSFNNGAQNLSGSAGTWTGANLFINNSANVTLTSDVTIGATNFTVGNTGAGTLNLGGFILTLSSAGFTSTATGNVTGAGTFRTQGTTSMSVNGAGTFDASLKVNTGTTTFANNFSFPAGSSITIDAGATLQAASGVVTTLGNLTNNGTLSGTISSTFAFSGTGTSCVNNGAITVNTFTFNNGAQNLSGSAGTWTGANLFINNSANVTLTSDVTIGATNFAVGQVNPGTLNLGGFILTLSSAGFTSTATGNVTGAGTFRTQGTTSMSVNGAGTFDASLKVNTGTTTFANNFSFPAGSSITIDAGATLQAASGVVTTLGNLTNNGTLSGTISSTFAFSGTGTSCVNNGAITVNTFTFNNGAQNLSGSAGTWTGANLLINNSANVAVISDVTIGATNFTIGLSGAGTFDITGRTLSLTRSGTPMAVTGTGTLVTTGSTIVYSGTAAQTVATTNITYNNLTINNTAGVTLSAAETVPATLTLTNGVFTIGANLTMGNGALIRRSDGSLSGTPTFGTSVNVEYFGSNPIASGTELPASATVLNNLTMNNLNTVTLGNARTVNGTLFLNSGTFSNGANLTMANGTTIQRDNGTLGSAPTFGSSVHVNYVGTPGVTTGPEIPSSATVLSNLTINKSGGVNLGAGGASVNGTLLLTNGTLAVGSSTLVVNSGITVGAGTLTSGVAGTVNYNQQSNGQSVLAINYGNLIFSNFNKVLPATINIAGTFTPGTAVGHTITGNTINFNGGGAQTIPAFNYNNLMSSNSGARTLQSTGTIRVASVFTPGGNSYTVTGSTVEYNGTLAQTLPSSFSPYNNLTSNNAAGVNGSGVAGLTVNGLLRVQAGTFTSASTYSVVQIDAGATLAATPASTINVSGNWTNNGSFAASTGTINLNGSAAQVINGSTATVFNNLTINNAAGVTLSSASIINGTLTLTAGAFTNGANLTMGNAANIKRDAGRLSVAPTFGASVNVEYLGTVAVTTGPEIPVSATVLSNLTDNKAGTVTLGPNATVNGTLALNTGTLAVGANTLTINNGTSVATGTLTSGATGTVNYNQGSNGQNVLAANYGHLTFGDFNKTLPSSGTVGIAGTFTTGNATGHTITGSTVNFNGSSAQTIPAFSYFDLTSSSTGARTLQSTGTIRIASSFTPGTNSYTITGSTIEYNGGSAQNAPGSFATYESLSVNNSAGVTIGGSVAVNASLTLTIGVLGVGTNTLTLNGGATATSGSFTSAATGTVNYNQSSNGQNSLAGNYGNLTFSNFSKTLAATGTIAIASTFTPGSAAGHTITGSTVSFNGSSAQSAPASFATYNNLEINNAAGVTLGGSCAVNGLLTLTSGALGVGTNTLTLNGGAAATGGSFTSAATGTVNYNQSSNGQSILAGSYGNLTFSNFSKTLPSSGTVMIAGVFTTGAAGGHTLTGSMVEFNGAVAQSMPPGFSTYNNLTINNASGVSLGASATVEGAFTRTSGSFSIGANTLTLNGAINATTGLNGGATSNLVIGGSAGNATLPAILLNNMTMNRAAGITLGGDLDVNGLLTLTSGIITATAGNPLTVGSAGSVSRSSGYIMGDHKKNFGGASSFTYHVGTANGYSQVDANATAGTGNLTVQAVQGPQPNVVAPARALQRYWTLSGAGITTDLTFNYLDPVDIPGTASESSFHLFKYNGSFTDMGAAGLDATNNKYTITGVSSFSDWTLAEQGAPTEITLEDFSARPVVAEGGKDAGTLLQWRTGTEVSNLGFYIHREEGGRLVRVTPDLIAGSALFAGANTVLTSGCSYSWRDAKPQGADTRYWLEEIDLVGTSRLHGPVVADARNKLPQKSLAGQMASGTLSDLGKQTSGDQAESDHTSPLETKAEMAKLTSATVSAKAKVVDKATVKLAVRHEGWYRITQPELVAAGLDAKLNPRNLQLYVDGIEQPIKVNGDDDGSFDSADAVEFYGMGVASPYTDSRVYSLVAAEQAGRRITAIEAHGGKSSPLGFPYTVERRDRTVYFSSLRNGDRENFFGGVITSNSIDQSLTLVHVARELESDATLEIALQGVTQTSHTVRVELNGSYLAELSFNGQSAGTDKYSFSHSLLLEGQNTVRLTSVNGPTDVSLVDFIRVTYPHTFTADSDRLRLTVPGDQPIAVDGFTSKAIRVFDVTDPNAPTELIGDIAESKTGYSVSVASPYQGQRSLVLVTASQAPERAWLDQPSNWRASTGADLVIVTRSQFVESLEPLVSLRQRQGLSVAVIDLEDLFDEFSYGQKTPFAIRAFFDFAKSNWKRPPRFALFVGDASYDPRNYLGLGDSDLVPTKLIDTQYLETASDDWFSDLDDDGVANVATGRLPVRNAEQAQSVVTKIVGYERGDAGEEALLVSDANDGFDFEAASAQLRGLLPANVRVTQVNRGRVDEETAKRALLDGIHRKQMIVNYVGHGSVAQWRGNLLTVEDANPLANTHLPVFVLMTCLNGYFQDAASDSLGEALLKAQSGGAIAAWASSGLTLPGYQSTMNQAFYRAMFGGKAESLTLGEAIGRAKASVSDVDVRRTWILLGDPAMRLK